jgi:nitroreductase
MSSEFPYRTRRTTKPIMMDGSRPIGREVLIEILEDAHCAPTHGLTQPWRFHVFDGESRVRLADALQSLYDRTTPPADIRPEKRAKLRDNLLQAPVCIAVVSHLGAGGKITEQDELCATACAVQNILLSSHQWGIGSFWSSSPVACSPAFATWLGHETGFAALGLIFLGYPKDVTPVRAVRVPLEERVIFHSI